MEMGEISLLSMVGGALANVSSWAVVRGAPGGALWWLEP
jgi:hypothetical protein